MRITHLAWDTPEEGRLKQLIFITQDEDQSDFYAGFERIRPFTKEEIDRQVARGYLIPIPPYSIDNTRKPWLFSDGTVWIALCERPLSDRHRAFLARSLRELAERSAQ